MNALLAPLLVATIGSLAAIFDAGGPAAAQTPPPATTYFRSSSCPLIEPRPDAMFIVPGDAFVHARLAERGAAAPRQAIWIDLSLQDNGFAPGTFVGAGPLAIDDSAYAFTWRGLAAGARHHYRLNVLTSAGWTSIGGGTFETPDCRNTLDVVCSDDASAVSFAIPHSPPRGESQPVASWLDLTVFNNGFAPATFLGFGAHDPAFVPYVPRGRYIRVGGMAPSVLYYYRLNVRYDDGTWHTQAAGSIMTPACANIPLVPPGRID